MVHTEQPLQKLLNKIAEEHNYKNPEIIINDLSSDGANYTSTLYTATIRENDKEDLHLFAKIGAIGEKMRETVPVDIYDTEKFAYTELWKIYAALEEEHGIPEEHRVPFTKCYGINPTKYQEIVVLENLLTQGYGPFDRFKPLDWEYASAALTECAKLHALSFAFQKQDPERFEKTTADLKMPWGTLAMEEIMEKSAQIALKAIHPEHKQAFEKFIEQNKLSELIQMYHSPVRNKIIAHGDFRGNNLLHRVREDGKIDIKVVDLQTLQCGSPAADMLYFIITGSDEQFRARYFDRLVDHYYSELSAAMRRLHLNPDEVYSREVFDHEFKVKLPHGLALALFLLPVITVDPDNAPKVDESFDLLSLSLVDTSDLFTERINGVINDYVKWGILK